MLARALAAVRSFRWGRGAPTPEPALREPAWQCDGTCRHALALRERLDLGYSMARNAISALEDSRGSNGQRKQFALKTALELLWRFINHETRQAKGR